MARVVQMGDMFIRVQRFTSTAIDDLRVSFACSTCNAVAEADVIVASSAEEPGRLPPRAQNGPARRDVVICARPRARIGSIADQVVARRQLG